MKFIKFINYITYQIDVKVNSEAQLSLECIFFLFLYSKEKKWKQKQSIF